MRKYQLLVAILAASAVNANSCLQFDVTFGYPGAYDAFNPMYLKVGPVYGASAYMDLHNISDETITVSINRTTDNFWPMDVIDFSWKQYGESFVLGPDESIEDIYIGQFRIHELYEYAKDFMYGWWQTGHFYAQTETGCQSEFVPYKAVVTPELSTWALLACSGLAGFVLRRRRKA